MEEGPELNRQQAAAHRLYQRDATMTWLDAMERISERVDRARTELARARLEDMRREAEYMESQVAQLARLCPPIPR